MITANDTEKKTSLGWTAAWPKLTIEKGPSKRQTAAAAAVSIQHCFNYLQEASQRISILLITHYHSAVFTTFSSAVAHTPKDSYHCLEGRQIVCCWRPSFLFMDFVLFLPFIYLFLLIYSFILFFLSNWFSVPYSHTMQGEVLGDILHSPF